MAYIDQEHKAKIAEQLKKVMPKDWKYSLRIHHNSQIIMTFISAPADLFNLHKQHELHSAGHIKLNPYYLERQYDGEVLSVMLEAKKALNIDNWDKSDISTDYFNVGHYVAMHIGRWDKPFVCTGSEVAA